jgi:hypothetical protein
MSKILGQFSPTVLRLHPPCLHLVTNAQIMEKNHGTPSKRGKEEEEEEGEEKFSQFILLRKQSQQHHIHY